jgi:predicted dehydrogenase
MSHETIEENEPVKIIVVGAGNMGKRWLAIAENSSEYEVVGLVDIDPAAAKAAVESIGRGDLPVSSELGELIASTDARAVANVTIPAAHHAITTQALLAGLAVVSEKPVAETLSESLSLAAAAQLSGQLFVVSQSRRHNHQLAAFKAQSKALGPIGIAVTDFFKAPHFGGFRDEMDHPLLLDMAIHPFDSARYLLDAEPVAVYCEEYNPSWSWYRGDAGATAIFEMTGGVRYVYTASWASPGQETSWNGSWRVSAERGSALWDGDNAPVSEFAGPDAAVTDAADRQAGTDAALEGVAASLHNFAVALHSGEAPSGEVHENILSLVMVEAAIESATAGRRIVIDELLATAHERAVADEKNPDVARVLESWESAGGVLREYAGRVSGKLEQAR